MKNQTLYKKLRETLNIKIIPKIIKLKNEIGKEYIEIEMDNLKVKDLYFRFEDNDRIIISSLFISCENETISQSDFHKLEFSNIDLVQICENFILELNKLTEEKNKILNLINIPISYKKELLTEKTYK